MTVLKQTCGSLDDGFIRGFSAYAKMLGCCSVGMQRFEGIVQNLNGTLMFEEYNMRILADVQQARKLLEPFSQAESMSDLFDKVMLEHAAQSHCPTQSCIMSCICWELSLSCWLLVTASPACQLCV